MNKNEIKGGRFYYTFYMEGGNTITNNTKVFKAKLNHKDSLGYGNWSIEGGAFSRTMSFNIHNRLNEDRCPFFDTEEEAIVAYNNKIDSFINKNDTEKQKSAKLKKKIIPKIKI